MAGSWSPRGGIVPEDDKLYNAYPGVDYIISLNKKYWDDAAGEWKAQDCAMEYTFGYPSGISSITEVGPSGDQDQAFRVPMVTQNVDQHVAVGLEKSELWFKLILNGKSQGFFHTFGLGFSDSSGNYILGSAGEYGPNDEILVHFTEGQVAILRQYDCVYPGIRDGFTLATTDDTGSGGIWKHKCQWGPFYPSGGIYPGGLYLDQISLVDADDNHLYGGCNRILTQLPTSKYAGLGAHISSEHLPIRGIEWLYLENNLWDTSLSSFENTEGEQVEGYVLEWDGLEIVSLETQYHTGHTLKNGLDPIPGDQATAPYYNHWPVMVAWDSPGTEDPADWVWGVGGYDYWFEVSEEIGDYQGVYTGDCYEYSIIVKGTIRESVYENGEWVNEVTSREYSHISFKREPTPWSRL